MFLPTKIITKKIAHFIALFVFLGAYGENQAVQQMELLKDHTVEEAMLLNITTFKPKDSLDLVVNKIISYRPKRLTTLYNRIVLFCKTIFLLCRQ